MKRFQFVQIYMKEKKNSKKKFNKTSCSDKHVKTETFPQIYVQVFCLFARIPVLSEFYSAIKFIK